MRIIKENGFIITEENGKYTMSWMTGGFQDREVTYPVSKELVDKALRSEQDAYEVELFLQTGECVTKESKEVDRQNYFRSSPVRILVNPSSIKRLFSNQEFEELLQKAISSELKPTELDAIGIVGPIIVVLCIAIGVLTVIRDGGNIQAGLDVIANGTFEGAKDGETIKNAGSTWLASGLSYAGFVLLWFASFTAALGAKNTKKNLNYGIIGGTLAVCIAIILVSFAQISNINTPSADGSVYVWNAAIPNLILAMKIWKPFSAIFAVVVFAGIYTTAVPLLYNPASRFAKEGTPKFKILTIVLAIIGLIVGLFLPFKMLVNYIYVLNGYVGALLIVFMLWKNIKDTFLKKKEA